MASRKAKLEVFQIEDRRSPVSLMSGPHPLDLEDLMATWNGGGLSPKIAAWVGDPSPREQEHVAWEDVAVGTNSGPHRGSTGQAILVADEADSDDPLFPVGVGMFTDPGLDDPFYGEFFGGEETDGGDSTCGAADVLMAKAEAATNEGFWNQIKNTADVKTRAKTEFNFDAEAADIAGEDKQVIWLRWKLATLSGSFMTNVRFSVSQDIPGRATFANECVLQRLIVTRTITYDDGTSSAATHYKVEGFGIDAQKKTSVVLDSHAFAHMNAGSVVVDQQTGNMKKIVKDEVSVAGAYGWGQYDGKGTAKYTEFYKSDTTAYDLTKIKFIGNTTDWTLKATVNANGDWVFKDTSVGIDKSGNWAK